MVKGYSQCQSQLYSVLFTAFRATPRLVVYWHHGVDPKLVKFLLGPGGVPDDRSMLDIVHLCIDTSPWVYDFRDERLDGVRESFPGTIKHLSLRASHCNPRAVQVLALLIGRLHLTLKTLRILGLNYMLFLELIDSIMDGCWHVYQYSQEGENGYTVTFP